MINFRKCYPGVMGGGLPLLVILMAGALLPCCGGMVRSATQPLIDNLSLAIKKQNDPTLVRDGAPAYLLLVDGLVEGSPEDATTLITAAELYSAYGSAFVAGQDGERARILADRARSYAFRAAAIEKPLFIQLQDKPFEEFAPVAQEFEAGDEKLLYLIISTWAGVVQTHSGDWNLVADISKIEHLTKRLLELDEAYYYGAGHLVLAVLASILPPALGGRPEEAKKHFDRALDLSKGKFLPAYLLYASQYARKTFNRELHDSLLKKALDTPADVEADLTLINTLARQQAERMLAEGDEFFE